MGNEAEENAEYPVGNERRDNFASVPSNDSSKMDVDEALAMTGPCGRFQYAIQIAFTYLMISIAYQAVISYFIGNEPSWRCVRNDTSSFCEKNFAETLSNDDPRFKQRCQLARDEWTYTTSNDYSVVTEFDLICEKTSIVALGSGIVFIGGGVGSFLFGIAADNYGRKVVLMFTLCSMVALSFGSSQVSNITQLIIIRFFLGVTFFASYSTAYVYLLELVSPTYRSMSTNLFNLGFPLSEWFIDIIAFYATKWRKIQLYASIPPILFIAALFALPKSPRWLVGKKQKATAELVLKGICMFNGNPPVNIHLKEPQHVTNEKNYNLSYLFRTRKVFFLTVTVGLLWFTIAMSYYTICFESSNLGGNMYQAFGLSALAEIPSKVVATYACNRFGRKKTVLIFLLLSGVFAGSTALIPRSFSLRYIFNITLLMIAKFSVDTSFMGLYLWTFELFPTVLRLQGWGVSSFLERLGSFSSPFLASVLHNVNPVLPYVIIMVLSFLSAAAGLILPETNKRPTRETYEDFFVSQPRIVPINGNVNQSVSNNETNLESQL